MTPAPDPAAGLAGWIAPSRTALVVIDMQVDFADPQGALGASVDMVAVPAALAAAGRLAEAARAVGAPVVFVGLFTEPATDSPAWRERMRRTGGDPEVDAVLCRAGAQGSAFSGPRPVPGEEVVRKTRYSGFYGTDLEARLRGLGVDTLVACGLTTECCVAQTTADAFHRDFHVFVAADACAAYHRDLHAAGLRIMALNTAILTTSAEVVAAWSSAAAARDAG